MSMKGIGLGGIVFEPTADLIRLQKELFDTIAPFEAPASAGSAAAYGTTPAILTLTKPLPPRLRRTFLPTRESITARTSRSESAQSSISMPCSLRRFPRSRFHLWEHPFISSETLELRRNNSIHLS
jgi:hypothetical protein